LEDIAMLARIRKAQEEEGFTLIELLVVIIIIGILAAIAIPVFLNQRKKGWDTAVKSDLRNAATAQETYNTDNGHYSATIGDLTSNGFKFSPTTNYASTFAGDWTYKLYDGAGAVTATATAASGGYCMQATSQSGAVWSYDSTKGGLQAKGTAC
jgi:type IV pilus assembly protein PilA